MGFNWAFKPYLANVENMVSSLIIPAYGRWGFISTFKPYPANVENMVS